MVYPYKQEELLVPEENKINPEKNHDTIRCEQCKSFGRPCNSGYWTNDYRYDLDGEGHDDGYDDYNDGYGDYNDGYDDYSDGYGDYNYGYGDYNYGYESRFSSIPIKQCSNDLVSKQIESLTIET